MSRAISKVFLAVHGVEREHPAAQSERSDQGLYAGISFDFSSTTSWARMIW